MKLDPMWIWWTFTVLICGWKLLEGLFRPYRMLEWPFMACAMWIYFYGYMAYEAKFKLSQYLGNGISNIGQLMPLLCLIGILVGWNLGTRSTARPPLQKLIYPYLRIWLGGFCFILLGTAGGFSVFRAVEEGTIDFRSSSAYWYLLFYVGYPGLAMALWALLKMGPGIRPYLWIITGLVLIAFMYPHIANARRGPLFPAGILILLVPPLTRRTSPNPLIFCGILALVGVTMLFFLQIRHTIYTGGNWNDAIHNLSLSAATEEKATEAEDNEYINNCQLIGTIYENGKYQYGTGHLSLLTHWIPRSMWRNKPVLGEGNYSYVEMFDDVEAKTGVRLLGQGAAAAGVSDTFVQYGVFCPLFWIGLSWVFGLVYVRARFSDNPGWLFCYMGIMCASHWLVSQSFVAAFVPLCCFQIVPLGFMLIFGRGKTTVAPSFRFSRRPGLREVPHGGA